MKKFFVMLTAIVVTFASFSQPVNFTLESSDKVDDFSFDSTVKSIVVSLQRNGNDILITLTNVLATHTESNAKCRITPVFVSFLDGDNLDVVLTLKESGEYTNGWEDLGYQKLTYRVLDVLTAVSAVRVNYNANMVSFGGPAYVPEKYHFVGTLSETPVIISNPENVASSLISPLKEWVIYNPSDSNGNSRFFRLRFSNAYPNESFTSTYRDLMLYEGSEYNADTATKIASYTDHEEGSCIPADVAVTSDFWGTGFSESTINPIIWSTAINSMPDIVDEVYMPFNWRLYNKDNYFDYYDYASNARAAGMVTSESSELVDGKLQVTFTIEDESLVGSEYIPWSAKWIQGIGPVGDTYSSNPVYPIYVLPSKITPAYLLYVRDITTNNILYGDPTLDPQFDSLKTETSGSVGNVLGDNSAQIDIKINLQTISVSSDSLVSVKLFDTNGRLISSVGGSNVITLSTTDLEKGMYILQAKNSDAVKTVKIIR